MLIDKIVQSCHKTKRLSISFKVKKILFHLRGKHLGNILLAKRKFRKISFKPFPDRNFSKMSERRISDVMDQARTLKYMRNILFHLRRKS